MILANWLELDSVFYMIPGEMELNMVRDQAFSAFSIAHRRYDWGARMLPKHQNVCLLRELSHDCQANLSSAVIKGEYFNLDTRNSCGRVTDIIRKMFRDTNLVLALSQILDDESANPSRNDRCTNRVSPHESRHLTGYLALTDF